MIRLASSYLVLSILAPVLTLLAFSGGSFLITGLMSIPLVVTTFAFLWLVLEVARRDGLLTRSQFLKCSACCGLASLLLVAGATQLFVHFAPSINLGAALNDFRPVYFVLMMAVPTIIYTSLIGLAFWYLAIRNNAYIQPYTKSDRNWLGLPRAARRSRQQTETKKAA